MADYGTLGSFTDFMTASRNIPLGTPKEIKNQMTRFRTSLRVLVAMGALLRGGSSRLVTSSRP